MAHHSRAPSTASGGPHAISLKVLRLTKPSLATQTPLPATNFGHGLDIPVDASLAYPGADAKSTFPLTTLLTLPAAFGAAYVGETFTCTLCANNEVQPGDVDGRSVSGVKITAELQTPGREEGVPLELMSAEDVEETDGEMKPGETVQRTVSYELKEQGTHVLAVTVTYYETLHATSASDGTSTARGGRVRTFRKLYQFVAQQLIAVRSKITERKQREKTGSGRLWILEAQVENVGETSVVLERVGLVEREGVASKAVNGEDSVVLKAGDCEQVMFLLKEEGEIAEADDAGRVALAQVKVDWRSQLGEKGSLTTGWLASRAR